MGRNHLHLSLLWHQGSRCLGHSLVSTKWTCVKNYLPCLTTRHRQPFPGIEKTTPERNLIYGQAGFCDPVMGTLINFAYTVAGTQNGTWGLVLWQDGGMMAAFMYLWYHMEDSLPCVCRRHCWSQSDKITKNQGNILVLKHLFMLSLVPLFPWSSAQWWILVSASICF